MPFEKPIETHTEKLPVKLSQDEFYKRATRIANLHNDLQQHVSASKSAQAVAAARKKELESQIFQLAEAMRSGEETRDVTVNTVMDAGEVLEIRTDTEEVLRRRAPRADEQQKKLFEDEPGTKPGDAADAAENDDEPEEH